MHSISSGFEINIENFNFYKKTGLNYLSKNTRSSTCQPVVIKYWSMRLILFLEPFYLSGNCPRKSRNLETRTQVLQNKTLVKNISVINEWRCFNLLLVSLDLLISRLRKLSTKTTETYWPETSNLFAVPKEMEDLSSSNATETEGGSDDTNEDVAN